MKNVKSFFFLEKNETNSTAAREKHFLSALFLAVIDKNSALFCHQPYHI